MSHLNKLVRRVLLEADAKSQTAQVEPQKAASASQPKIKAAARAVKGRENAIAPASYVDPSAYVVGTTVGFGNSTMADVKAQRAQKASASVIDQDIAFIAHDIAVSRAGRGGANPPEPDQSDYDAARKYTVERHQGERLKSQILGDSAVSDSTIGAGSTVSNSAVSEGVLTDSKVSGGFVTSSRVMSSNLLDCKLTDAAVNSANLTGCKVSESSVESDMPGKNALTAQYSSFINRASVYATVPCTVVSSVVENSSIRLGRSGSKIYGSRIKNADISLTGGARVSMISSADIEGASIGGTGYAMGFPHSSTMDSSCDVVIKGASGNPVYIRNAEIRESATIIATKGKAPQITGYESQFAVVEGRAKVYDSAHVAGRVSGNAEVFGNAQVEANATITGDCRVGGTAIMTKGTYTTGEYMEGTHTGGDDGNTSIRIQKKVKDAVGTAVSSLKSLAGVEDK